MKLTAKNTKGKGVKIRDAMGKEIKTAFYYDTKTCEVGIYLVASANAGKYNIVVAKNKNKKIGNVVKVKLIIPGSFAEINGIRVN